MMPSEPADAGPSYITKIPLDILLSVVDFLDAASHNALRLTCREFDASLANRSMDEAEKSCFAGWIRQDLFHKNCERELHRLLPDGIAVCQGCVRTHDRSMFSEPALRTPPTERRCLAYEKRLRVCSHTDISLDELRRRLEDGRRWFDQYGSVAPYHYERRLCTREKHARPDAEGDQPRLLVWPQGFGAAGPWQPEVEIVRFYPLFRAIEGPFIVKDGMVTALDASVCVAVTRCSRNACPHLNAARPFSLFRRKGGFSTTAVKDHNTARRPFPGDVPPARAAEWKCTCRACDTMIGLYHDAFGKLHFATRRRVGDLESAMDPRWLSQLELPPPKLNLKEIKSGFLGQWPTRNGKRIIALIRP